MTINELQAYCKTLAEELETVKEENCVLRRLLKEHGVEYDLTSNEGDAQESEEKKYSDIEYPSVKLGVQERVALFCSLFRGREDVFARRWFSKTTGKSGYQPVCVNEWRRGVCDKKKFKCADCPNRSFAPLGYADIYNHLEGKDEQEHDVVGLYAIMPDNNCAFLCTDFDDKSCKHGYKDDVKAFVGVCRDWAVTYSIERSRSGKGAHVWIFFEDSIPAFKARRLGNAILTEAMSRDGRMSFDSYDRFFPNQDRMPEGGFGNLVALPLQGKARRNLNSVFVDDDFLAYKDQWVYLNQVGRISEQMVDTLLQHHNYEELGRLSTSSESQPWITPIPESISRSDFDEAITITVADKIYISIKSVTAKVLNHIKRMSAFKNPDFYSKQAMRMSTYGVPRIISSFDIMDDYLAMPRGCIEAICQFLDGNQVRYNIVDESNHGTPIDINFIGEEREEQKAAVDALIQHDNGILHATTAFGKTVTAASIIAQKKVNTLILVHSTTLLAQWHERLTQFLDINYQEPETQIKRRGRKKAFSTIGCLDSKRNTLHGVIDIALMQSCVQDGEVKPFVKDYGMVIVDECHHAASVTYEQVAKSLNAHIVYGLTATPIRKDGHQPILFMQFGPIRFVADAKAQMDKQSFQRYLIPRFTSYRELSIDGDTYTSLLPKLAEDELRNQLIVDDITKVVHQGRTPIILTKLVSHVETIASMLEPYIQNVIRLTGVGKTREKRNAMQKLLSVPKEEALAIVATGSYVGEGFDYPRLDTLFLALPISWKGTVQQYVGRLHRDHEGKQDVRVYDYIDIHIPLFDTMYHRRMKGYSGAGYRVISKETPSLFDATIESQCRPSEGQIFNGKSFFKPFQKDVVSANSSIVIASPKLYLSNKIELLDILRELTARGVEVVIITKKESEHSEFAMRKGLEVRIVPNMSLCCCIIDKATLWYGDVNFLGYSTDENNVIKVEDRKLANELLGILSEE